MPSDFSSMFLTLSVETAPMQTSSHRTELQYSQISPVETRLPAGVAPAALLDAGTGELVVGDSLLSRTSELHPLVAGSLEYIRAVASALPIDEQDERIVDALLAKRQQSFAIKPLRRREGR